MLTNANLSTASEWLSKATAALKQAGLSTARLDCLVLLEDATGKDRAYLLAHPKTAVQGSTLYSLNECVKRRTEHEPLAYIRGKTEFYGREFLVNAHTLEPRPETETMLELLKQLVNGERRTENVSIVDVGTGSGCIAITAKLEMPELDVLATDIDEKCLEAARKNAKNLDAKVAFYQGNLLQPVLGSRFSVLLCNLPYVPDKYELNAAAKFEPKHAIFGGEDGLDLYRELFRQVTERTSQPAYILTESLPFQHKELGKIAAKSGFQHIEEEDFIQVFKKLT